MFRRLHMTALLSSPLTALMGFMVLNASGLIRHPESLLYSISDALPEGRKIVKIRDKIFEASKLKKITVPSHQHQNSWQTCFARKINNTVWGFRFRPSQLHLKTPTVPFLGTGSKLQLK